ncbi:MAG: NAD(P)-binding domain-containing protein [Tissierellia bacterium]|nr:NAD(P)-binding domain-containing protein [Tissierellia bacterium]MDD4779418.1 NAD(P)-binding domain-containing protein [Tissierellia bacterium]
MNAKFGLIGLGNMGTMILDQLLNLNLLNEKEVYVANRSKEKLENFKKEYNSINLCDNIEVAKNCRNIMLCVEPSNVPSVLLEIMPFLNENSYLMISTATVAYNDLYKIYKGKITKFMPTLNSTVRGGVTLVCHNELVLDEEKKFFEDLMSNMSEVQVIKEEDMNLCHNLTGSLPAIISELMLEFVRAASKHSINMTMEEIEHMVMVSLAGASKLFIEKDMKFEDTIKRVSTKGGITFEGIKLYEKKMPEIFNEAFDITIKKYDDITANVSKIIDDLVK